MSQVWRCARCGVEQQCLSARSVTCPKGHSMELVSGEPSKPTTKGRT